MKVNKASILIVYALFNGNAAAQGWLEMTKLKLITLPHAIRNNPIRITHWFYNNIHALDKEGLVFRSKVLPPAILEQCIQEKNIRCILNLCEPHEYASWYFKEVALAQQYDITIINIPLNARQFPSSETMAQLIEVILQTQQPLLVHCKAGADRTGLFAALWKLIREQTTLEEALEQQRLWPYGHIKYLYPKMRKTTRYIKYALDTLESTKASPKELAKLYQKYIDG